MQALKQCVCNPSAIHDLSPGEWFVFNNGDRVAGSSNGSFHEVHGDQLVSGRLRSAIPRLGEIRNRCPGNQKRKFRQGSRKMARHLKSNLANLRKYCPPRFSMFEPILNNTLDLLIKLIHSQIAVSPGVDKARLVKSAY